MTFLQEGEGGIAVGKLSKANFSLFVMLKLYNRITLILCFYFSHIKWDFLHAENVSKFKGILTNFSLIWE